MGTINSEEAKKRISKTGRLADCSVNGNLNLSDFHYIKKIVLTDVTVNGNLTVGSKGLYLYYTKIEGDIYLEEKEMDYFESFYSKCKILFLEGVRVKSLHLKMRIKNIM